MSNRPLIEQWLERFGAPVAVVGAVMASLGDAGQLWVVNAARPALALAAPPSGLVVWATLLGAFGIPLYGTGYCARVLRASAGGRAAAVVTVAGVAFGALGGAVHATTGALIAANPGGIAGGLDPLQGVLHSGPIALSLWVAAGIALVVAGLAELSLAERRRDWLLNPLVLTLLIGVLSPLAGLPWRDFIEPASVNLAHLVFFLSLARRAGGPTCAGLREDAR